MEKITIYIVEDDPFFSKLVEHKLSLNPDYDVHLFTNEKDFLAKYNAPYSIVLLDYHLPDSNGFQLLQKIKKKLSYSEVIIMSNQQEIQLAIDVLKAGAFDYIEKNEEVHKIIQFTVMKAVDKLKLYGQINSMQNQLDEKYAFKNFIKGNSKAIVQVHDLLEKTSNNNLTVSITGETGTGKELIAKSIHFNSNRKSKKFIPINVAAIPKELIESELFGYEKGAFTGADKTKIGKFEEADGGTLFLDEIGEMDLIMQSKLLRVLQERELFRLGSNNPIPIDVRLIVATHKNLLKEVHQGNFREDLFYRLMGIKIELPRLIDRGDDIILLSKYFIIEFCKANKLPMKTLSDGAVEKLYSYHYPGNIRELKSIIEIAVVMSNDMQIQEQDIQFVTELRFDPKLMHGNKTLKEYEIEIITHYLEKNDKNVVNVAKILDIGKSTIYRMIKEGQITI